MTASTRHKEEPARPLVLVVDDEPGIVEFLRYALEDNGYRVETAHDGGDALAKIDDAHPNLVLTDLMMPRMDGWELCRRLRARGSTRTLPIIGMSAIEPRGAPLNAFVRKPFELDDLLAALSRFERKQFMPRPGGAENAARKPC